MQIHLKTAEEVSKFWHERMSQYELVQDDGFVYHDFKINHVKISKELAVVRNKKLVYIWQILEVTRL